MTNNESMAPENSQRETAAEGQSQDAGKRPRQIYLTLPPMKRETFEKTIAKLKEDGARFDSYSKAWYITPEMDFNKFKNYLGAPYEYVNVKAEILRALEVERRAEPAAEKGSVSDKLDRNKDAVNKNVPAKEEPEHKREQAR